MKVLLVNKYHYFRGGSETYYFGLAELLRKAGHEVIFFAMEDEHNLPCAQSEYFVSNVEFNGKLSALDQLKAAARMVYSLEAKRKFDKLLRNEKPDIIHINLFHRVLTASIVDVAKKHHIPIVFTMHDLNCICPNHTMLNHGKICEACLHGNYMNCVKCVCFKDSRLKCLMAAVESEYNKLSGLYNKIDCFITPSEFYKNLLMKSGLTKKRIIHMKNFLPVETEYGIRGKRGDYVLFFGRLSYEKGILTLIEAMKHVKAPLLIAGTGPEEETIRQKIAVSGLSDRVTLLGFKSGTELWSYVMNAGCVVIPSEWYEASGYTACEAQAMGKPVVVTDAGGLPENIVNGETGIVCPMSDVKKLAEAINCIMIIPDEGYERMARRAVNNAQMLFDASRYVQRVMDIYQGLVARR